jgi:phosphoesterase RecJ-like protein
MTITEAKIQDLKKLINNAKHIVITAHKSPDGDSIGSSLGLFHYLSKITSNVYICHPDIAPKFLRWIPGFESIKSLDKNEGDVKDHFDKADLIFCLDYNSSSRIGLMETLMNNSTATKVMVDHHRDPDPNFCELMFSDISSCSTSQLIYEIIEASGDVEMVDQTVGTPLYCGIVTDTGSFRFSSTQPRTHKIAADLIERGVEHWKAHENIYDTNTLDRIQLTSYALLEKLVVDREHHTAFISLDQEELRRFSASKGDTEGLVNQALAIEGVQVAVFFKESDGLVKISFRSKGSIPVNNLAKMNFSGGGHLNAAGGKFIGNINNAIKKFVTILPKFVEENKSHFE